MDETFHVADGQKFYIVAAAVVNHSELNETRNTLKNFYGGEPMHAAPMYSRGEMETLRQGMVVAGANNDACDIVVCAPVEDDDPKGDAARDKCVSYIGSKIHADFGSMLFVIDHRGTTPNELDQRTFRDLRRSGNIHRDSVAHHCRPSQEPLLGLPDLLAWSYRQKYVRSDESWFEPFASYTEVKVL